MTRVILDRATLARLHDLKERLEVCDESGETLGFFQPAPSRDRSLYATAQVPVTEAELDRAEQQPGGRTLAEILADLESRT
jgi:hypothetical protein